MATSSSRIIPDDSPNFAPDVLPPPGHVMLPAICNRGRSRLASVWFGFPQSPAYIGFLPIGFLATHYQLRSPQSHCPLILLHLRLAKHRPRQNTDQGTPLAQQMSAENKFSERVQVLDNPPFFLDAEDDPPWDLHNSTRPRPNKLLVLQGFPAIIFGVWSTCLGIWKREQICQNLFPRWSSVD